MPRKPNDAYMTPQPLADEICRRLKELGVNPKELIEPSAGAGAFLRAARKTWRKCLMVAVDIDQANDAALYDLCDSECCDFYGICDWLVQSKTAVKDFHLQRKNMLILGNPPYSDAQAHVEAALDVLGPKSHLAFLLRMSFLGSQERAKTLWARPGLRYLMPLAQRPSFTGGGTDTSEYAVFIWEHGYSGLPELLPHLWVGKLSS